MKKAILLNEMIRNNSANIYRYELIQVYKDNINTLRYVKDENKCSIERITKKSFIEEEKKIFELSNEEYDVLVDFIKNSRDEVGILKNVYQLDDSTTVHVYEDMYEGLIKLVTEEENNKYDSLGIDITDEDISNDERLINLTNEDFVAELAQIRLKNGETFDSDKLRGDIIDGKYGKF